VFALKLKSELVFDGDAGVTAPSTASTRIGVDWGNTIHFNDWLSANLNAAFTQARFDQNSPADDLGCSTAAASHPCASPPAIVGRYIPNSPTNVIDAAMTASHETGWFGSVRARHFGGSPLIEDNSAKAPAYTTVDAQLGFRQGHHWLVALDVFNLFDTRWNDIEYYYVSRLPHESGPRADYVIHAGVPRTLRARFQWEF
jgi:outer membrane receptor protein involved in Fe transport